VVVGPRLVLDVEGPLGLPHRLPTLLDRMCVVLGHELLLETKKPLEREAVGNVHGLRRDRLPGAT
jgi:hypothetical protein